MNSKEFKELIENHTKDLIDICPHCWAKVHIEKLWSDYHSFRNWDLEFYITFRCKPCKKLLLKTFYFEENKYDFNYIYYSYNVILKKTSINLTYFYNFTSSFKIKSFPDLVSA